MTMTLDSMIPLRNSYLLAEGLPERSAVDVSRCRHGSLFQYHECFVQQATLFLGRER